MKTLANWLLVIFMFMYWVFRLVVTYMEATGRTFVTTPINTNVEIALLFITVICMALVLKRKSIGGIIYVVCYIGYFGVDLFNQLKPMLTNHSFDMDAGMGMFFSAIGVILALAVMIDLLSDHLKHPEDKKTEWFYENKQFDRKMDDRADKNNYKLN